MVKEGFCVRLTKDLSSNNLLIPVSGGGGDGGGGGGGGGGSVAGQDASAKKEAPRIHRDPTPPFCGCMRRAKKQTIQRFGPDVGRAYFKCGTTGKERKTCKFFIWCASSKKGK